VKSFFIVVVLMLRNGGAQTRIGGAPRAKESITYEQENTDIIMDERDNNLSVVTNHNMQIKVTLYDQRR